MHLGKETLWIAVKPWDSGEKSQRPRLSQYNVSDNLPILGFLINPVAGMGGAVGLKGTDGAGTFTEALKLGAMPVSPKRGREFLSRLMRTDGVDLLVGPGSMGASVAKKLGLKYKTVGRAGKRTTARDTVRIAALMKRRKVDLLVFCGGDGTARDVLKAVDGHQAVLGVPSGVKVYSSVFGINPVAAADTASQFLTGGVPTRQGEVLDIDEKLYRGNHLAVKLAGYLAIPDAGFLIQDSKMATRSSEAEELESVAKYVREEMEPGTIYVLGPGTTVEKVGEKLGVKKTLLGVDVVKGDGTVLGRDVDESKLLELIGKGPVKIVVSPIGGQGFLFGRGNQQISSQVLRQVGVGNLMIVASRTKMDMLNPRRLLVDTGDPELDSALRGYRRVVTGYREKMVVKVE
jgi:predicted polyphosphate/ATP-dependent NAD kinase